MKVHLRNERKAFLATRSYQTKLVDDGTICAWEACKTPKIWRTTYTHFKKYSPTGNRTLVSCVTGRDTSHYNFSFGEIDIENNTTECVCRVFLIPQEWLLIWVDKSFAWISHVQKQHPTTVFCLRCFLSIISWRDAYMWAILRQSCQESKCAPNTAAAVG